MALFAAAACCAAASAAWAQTGAAETPEQAFDRAAVVVDGREIAKVRGVAGMPAEERAAAIEERIIAAARDPDFDPSSLHLVETDEVSKIQAGPDLIMGVFAADAALEGMDRHALALVELRLIGQAIAGYRESRAPGMLMRAVERTAAATGALVLALALVVWASRRVASAAAARWKARILAMRVPALEMAPGPQVWVSVQAAARGIRFLVVALILYVFVEFTLRQFPATRPVGERLASMLLDPLRAMGREFVNELPSLLFLLVLYFVVRLVLRMLRLYFATIESGTVRVEGFEAHWSGPTYRLVRVAVIGFALVVAYPYIPGSETEAFKGLSIFAGILLSIGSSSFVANYIAGYTLIYRRLFAIGDRVRIGDVVGEVMEMRVQVTRLRTPKNEEVIIPNSTILQSVVTNYSSYAKDRRLILHTTVGIGYEVPWRQVEGMLLTAAERTSGVLKDPPPFVLQRGLGDFAVTYEGNVHGGSADDMLGRYAELHAHIQDVFNEYGVQIMTPAYEGDPAEPKVVPRERWHAAPSRRPAT
jgi:small-conductance mechanosensitive channel